VCMLVCGCAAAAAVEAHSPCSSGGSCKRARRVCMFVCGCVAAAAVEAHSTSSLGGSCKGPRRVFMLACALLASYVCMLRALVRVQLLLRVHICISFSWKPVSTSLAPSQYPCACVYFLSLPDRFNVSSPKSLSGLPAT